MKHSTSVPRKPMGRFSRVIISLVITAVVGLIYFYVALPALNPQSGDFYSILILLCLV